MRAQSGKDGDTMAVDDIGKLREQLPDLFKDKPLPPGWEEDWVFVEVPKPESATLPTEAPSSMNEDIGHQEKWPLSESDLFGESPVPGERTSIDTPNFRDAGSFPGSPVRYEQGMPVPPPDTLGFYLPFHYYHPIWWGVYLVAEGIEELAWTIRHLSDDRLTFLESAIVARIFIYGHEIFHHIVESFATRLEVTHRTPLYRAGFQGYFKERFGTEDAIEEALASAHGYRRVRGLALKHPKDPEKRNVALAALEKYIEKCPPGYDRALEFIADPAFSRGRSVFAEENHQKALPNISGRGEEVWLSFPHAFHGIGQVNSRVNYTIHRDSPIWKRLRTRGHFLRYREVEQRLKSLGSCTLVGSGKGSHRMWKNPSGRKFPVPFHPGDLNPHTLQKIIKQAGLKKMSLRQFVSGRP
jgi:predicted RNA binding protein YcfA (HicA-like mRNA interferase family)